MGWPDNLFFVRGNIHIRILGEYSFVNDVFSIVEIAQEIDAWIVEALEEAERNAGQGN